MIKGALACLKLVGPALAVMQLGGCCMIGAGLGAAADWDKPDERVFRGYDLADLRTGAEVTALGGRS
jgi:hypothetical protein